MTAKGISFRRRCSEFVAVFAQMSALRGKFLDFRILSFLMVVGGGARMESTLRVKDESMEKIGNLGSAPIVRPAESCMHCVAIVHNFSEPITRLLLLFVS